ncbi:PAS domain-containing protein [Myxococcota bacterium]|nr:PAS domain-containing protein [Myxococcota bacterium]
MDGVGAARDRASLRTHFELRALTSAPIPELFARAGALVEALTDSRRSVFAFVTDGGAVIDAGRALEGLRPGGEPGAPPLAPTGAVHEVLRERRPVFVDDDQPDVSRAPTVFADARRFTVVPVVDASRVVMVAGVADKPAAYTPFDAETVELVAGTVWQRVQYERTVDALRRSEERLKLALAAANQGIFDVDLVSGDVFVSPEYAAMLGYAPAELQLTAASWIDRVHPEDRDDVERTSRDYLAGRTSELRFECRHRTKDGGWRWLLAVGRIAERDASGRPLRLLGTHTDVEVRRREQEERGHLVASLAQADRLASMGLLAAGVAHEINNPLTYVVLTLEDLREELPKSHRAVQRCLHALAKAVGTDEVVKTLGGDLERIGPPGQADVVERLARANEALRRVKKIVRGLGTFARVDEPDVGAVSLERSIDHALALAHNEIKYRARVKRSLERVPPVVGSESKLAQVFLNLLINAAHAIEAGHLDQNVISVRTWAEGPWVYAEVADTGHGIPAALQPKLFQPFVTTKAAGVGSGLGLSICRRIVEELGGTITFTSTPGEGTRFVLKLVATAPEDVPATEPPMAEPTEEHPRPAGRILVIDDELGVRIAMLRVLQDSCAVLTAASGDEARELLSTDHHFDVIFCDLMMPRTTGMELHAWLAARSPAMASRVVFITGGAFTSEAAAYLARVGNPTLEKPFDRATLLRLTAERIQAARADAH